MITEARKSLKNKICVLCGVNPATTTEHVPPKAIFYDPLPLNLPTVPACKDCNNSSSKEDQFFQVIVYFLAGTDTLIQRRFFKRKVSKTINKNKKLLRELLSGYSPLNSERKTYFQMTILLAR